MPLTFSASNAAYRLRIVALVGLAAGGVALSGEHALAQTGLYTPTIPGLVAPETSVPERQSVSQRARPDYDPLGLRMGSFLLFPSVDLTEEYNSNVYVTQTGAQSDFFTSLRPSMTFASDWNNNALNFHTDGEIRRYASLVSENESNFDAATNGRLDIQQDVYLTGGLGYQLGHEDRTSPNSVTNEKSPTLYQLGSATAAFVHESGTVGARLTGEIDDYGYNNNITSTGTPIPESYRDRIEYNATPQVSYEYIPGYHAFIRAPVNWREYNTEFDPTGFKQSSHGYDVLAGTTVGLGQIINGEVYAGYFQQDYDDPRFKSPGGVDFGGNALWNVTPIDSIRAGISRSVQETTLQPASSYVETDVSITGEHELLRNVILTANATYSNQEYQGIARTDNVYAGGVGGRYLITRNLSAGLSGTYSDRDSNTPTDSYKQTIVMANLRLQY